MKMEKVDFLDDLDKTIEYLKSVISPDDKLVKLKFYTPGKTDDNNSFERSFYNFNDINIEKENYLKVEKITMILKNNDILKTYQFDKKNGIMVSTDNSKKSKLDTMMEDIDTSNIYMDDKCTYYKFEFGNLGKYDPDKGNYYLYQDGKWVIDGAVERWITDPAYEYEIIKNERKIPRL